MYLFLLIIRHLLSDQQDPFNRDPLTIDELEEYNNKIEVKEELKVLNEKIKKYISENDM